MDETLFVHSLVMTGVNQCVEAIDGNENLLVALFLAGFAGGGTHCIGMCAPFVVSQVQTRLEAVPLKDMGMFTRLKGGALVPYHLGRGVTYMALGAVAAGVSGQMMNVSVLKYLGAGLLAFAALFFLGYALKGLGVAIPALSASGEGSLSRAWGRLIKPLFAAPTGFRGFALGLALGFLPCGLLYGALAASAASGDWLLGLFAMMAFWLGTVPALFGVGLAGGAILGRWPDLARQVAPVLLVINAGFLAYLAWGLI